MGNAANNGFDPKTFLAKVGAGKTILNIKKNQHVFEQGEVADTVFYIQKGRVKLTVLSEQGKEAVVGILEPGQFFGEGCLNGHTLRIATTTAMEECVINLNYQRSDDRHPSYRTEIFRAVHGVSLDTEQPD